MSEQCVEPTTEIKVGDFVCFERIGAERDWRNTIGKVLSFPTSHRARVVWFDRSDVSPQANPAAEGCLRVVAEREGKLSEWNRMHELLQQLREAMEEEDSASASLFKARESTLQRQGAAAAETRVAMEALDRARDALERVPQRLWRDVRSPGRPAGDAMPLVRAVLAALQEDYVPTWEAMQAVMRQADFMDRVMALDCTATPMTKQQRKKILAEISARGASRATAAAAAAAPAQRPTANSRGSMARSATVSVARRSESAPQGTQLEVAIREWLCAQIACSEAREAEDAVVDGCFAELQEQAVLVREVNIMRENISMLQEKLLENRKALCINTSIAELLLGEKVHKMDAADTLFYQRVDVAGRPVTEIITLKAILVNFGSLNEEADNDGGLSYVCLSQAEVATLRSVVTSANEDHDVQELEDLFATSEREEEEMRDLRQRMEELRRKDDFTEDDEEEMRQLDALLTDVTRRHEVTLWRIRQMQAAGRDKRFLQLRYEATFIFSDLQAKFSGEHWQELLADDTHRENIEAAFKRDISKAFDLSIKYISNVRFTPDPFTVDFTLRHSPDIGAEGVQSLAYEAEYTEVISYYKKFANQRTYPLNTPSQIKAYKRSQEYATLMNFSGAGATEDIKQFESSEEGETDDEDHRRPQIELSQVRIDYDATARHGFPFYALTDVPDAIVQVEHETSEAREAKIHGSKPRESETRESETRESEPRELYPCESEPCETEPHEAEPRESETHGLYPCEAEPCEAEPHEAEPREAEPHEAEPRESETHGLYPCEAEPCVTEAAEEPNAPVVQKEEKENDEQKEDAAYHKIVSDNAAKDPAIDKPLDNDVEYPVESDKEETKKDEDELRKL